MDMRKIVLLIMSLVVVLGVFRLGAMASVPAMGMMMHGHGADCPMGFVCPADYESAQLIGSVSTAASLGLLLAFVAAFFAALALPVTRPYRAPAAVFTDSGPPALRSVFKKE